MLKFLALSALLVTVSATGYGKYGSYGSYGGNYGGNQGYTATLLTGLSGSGLYSGSTNYGSKVYTAGYDAGNTYGSSYSGGVVNAAVQSRRTVNVVDVPTTASNAEPLTVEVQPNSQPINFLFRSKSSELNLENSHETSPGSYRETSSQDEPHVVRHTVTRPVVQELKEVILPYRKVEQEVQPVQEEVTTLLSRGQQTYSSGSSYGAGRSYGAGGSYGSLRSNYGTTGQVVLLQPATTAVAYQKPTYSSAQYTYQPTSYDSYETRY